MWYCWFLKSWSSDVTCYSPASWGQELYVDFVSVWSYMLPNLHPGCGIEVVFCFCLVEWVYLSFPRLLVYHSHLSSIFISFTCVTQSKFTVACIKYSFQKRKDAIFSWATRKICSRNIYQNEGEACINEKMTIWK